MEKPCTPAPPNRGINLGARQNPAAERLPGRRSSIPATRPACATWTEAELVLDPGDSLVVVSDGVLDAFPSVEDFTEAVQRATSLHPRAEETCAALMQLAPAESAEDDVTAVVIRREATASGQSSQETNARVCLVIEDDHDIRGLLTMILTGMGFEVHAAATGTAGLQAAETLDLDLITLDLGLPDLNGLDVARHLRALSTAPILMITAWAEISDELNGVASGADAYLTKPFHPHTFRELVQRLCPPEPRHAPPVHLQGTNKEHGLSPPAAAR